MGCHICTVKKFMCEGCDLSELFPPDKCQEFRDILINYFADDLKSIKKRVQSIPFHLRKLWVELKPLPKPKPMPEGILESGKPCYPCWLVEPDEKKCCRGCPLTNHFSKLNADEFEIILLSHNYDLVAVRAEVDSFIKKGVGHCGVNRMILDKLFELNEAGALVANQSQIVDNAIGADQGKVDKAKCVKVESVEWPFSLYFDDDNEDDVELYKALLSTHSGCFPSLLEEFEPYLKKGHSIWNAEMFELIKGKLQSLCAVEGEEKNAVPVDKDETEDVEKVKDETEDVEKVKDETVPGTNKGNRKFYFLKSDDGWKGYRKSKEEYAEEHGANYDEVIHRLEAALARSDSTRELLAAATIQNEATSQRLKALLAVLKKKDPDCGN